MAQPVTTTDPDDRGRAQRIADVFDDCFGDMAVASPEAFRSKFRKMAASDYGFYRGSTCLFYADLSAGEDPFVTGPASRVWIHGDLHAENFGTYMTGEGEIAFDVNDFDEAYVGPFTWDVRRLVVSLALLGYGKALSDDEITDMVSRSARAYVEGIERFNDDPDHERRTLTRDTTSGLIHEVLLASSCRTRVDLLAGVTVVEGYERRFATRDGVRKLDDDERAEAEAAFGEYLATIPGGGQDRRVRARIKDIVGRQGVGIGSAGLPSYNFLLEGHTQALENDVLLYMKQAQVATPSRFLPADDIRDWFAHDGHRCVASQQALQGTADPWLGYCELRGVGQLVAEVSPYAVDLDWDIIDTAEELLEISHYLGEAAAKIHCVTDDDTKETPVGANVDEAIASVLRGREDEFVDDMVRFAADYARQVRQDHRLFVDLFRNHQLLGL